MSNGFRTYAESPLSGQEFIERDEAYGRFEARREARAADTWDYPAENWVEVPEFLPVRRPLTPEHRQLDLDFPEVMAC
ncbi:MAG TPA: hypothetical protein VGH38_10170 [Bryobacteraceae bacterium]|jgi:hypothetical protein